MYISYFQMKNILMHEEDLKYFEENQFSETIKSPTYYIIKYIQSLQIFIFSQNWTTFWIKLENHKANSIVKNKSNIITPVFVLSI